MKESGVQYLQSLSCYFKCWFHHWIVATCLDNWWSSMANISNKSLALLLVQPLRLWYIHWQKYQKNVGIYTVPNVVTPYVWQLIPCKTGKILKDKANDRPEMVWPMLFKRYMDDGFGTMKGSTSSVEYFILEFNKFVELAKNTLIQIWPKSVLH